MEFIDCSIQTKVVHLLHLGQKHHRCSITNIFQHIFEILNKEPSLVSVHCHHLTYDFADSIIYLGLAGGMMNHSPS